MEHGGRYTCGPTLGISDNITVHIIAGEKEADFLLFPLALQHALHDKLEVSNRGENKVACTINTQKIL